MAEKKRLDILVYEKGFAESREKAKAIIMAGLVYVDNQKADKPGTVYSEDCNLEYRGEKQKYVSRGGYKLEKAIKKYELNLDDLICMDIGASTGGFTDCMLQNGAKHVYSVDVGYGQLAWKLRCDERVTNMERTNIRYVTHEQIEDNIDFFSIDVAFISLKLVIPTVKLMASKDARGVFLIKPQFEAGRESVGKKGVVRDKSVHVKVVEEITNFCIDNGFSVLGLEFSPIKGPEGNIEYLIYVRYDGESQNLSGVTPQEVVDASHNELDK